MIQIVHPTDKVNFSVVTAGDLEVWFSYETPIAFHLPHTGLILRAKGGPATSNTTAKHIAYVVRDYQLRHVAATTVNEDEFMFALAQATPQAVVVR